MTNSPPLFEKLGLNLSETKFIIIQNCFFMLFPLTSPNQYHTPTKDSCLEKQTTKQKPSTFYSENSWNFMPFSSFSTTIPVHSSSLCNGSTIVSCLPGPSALRFYFQSFTFSRDNLYQTPAYNFQWLRVSTNKVQIL